MNFKRFQVNENVLAGGGGGGSIFFLFFFLFFRILFFTKSSGQFFLLFSPLLSFFLCYFLFSMFTLLLCERTTKNESCKFICQVCGYAAKKKFLFFHFLVSFPVLICFEFEIYIYFFPTFFFVSNSVFSFLSHKRNKKFLSQQQVRFSLNLKTKKKKE